MVLSEEFQVRLNNNRLFKSDELYPQLCNTGGASIITSLDERSEVKAPLT